MTWRDINAFTYWSSRSLSPECHRFLSAFQPSAYTDIGDLNAQCPTLAHCLRVWVCVSECLGAPLCSELQILKMKERSLPAELFVHFSFSLAAGWRNRKRERQKEDGRNETKTCSETENEERWLAEKEGDATEKSAAWQKMDGERRGGVWSCEKEIKIKRKRADGDGEGEHFPVWQQLVMSAEQQFSGWLKTNSGSVWSWSPFISVYVDVLLQFSSLRVIFLTVQENIATNGSFWWQEYNFEECAGASYIAVLGRLMYMSHALLLTDSSPSTASSALSSLTLQHTKHLFLFPHLFVQGGQKSKKTEK